MYLPVWSAAESGLFAATGEISQSVNRWFRRSDSFSENWLWGGIVAAIVVLWLGLYLWDRFRKPRKTVPLDRDGLFAQLCDLHNLSKSERQLLKSAAKTLEAEQPALAFVHPGILWEFAQTNPQTAEIQTLANRLFGKSLTEEIVRQSRLKANNRS